MKGTEIRLQACESALTHDPTREAMIEQEEEALQRMRKYCALLDQDYERLCSILETRYGVGST